MPRSQPDTATLLRMAVEHLDKEVYPTLEGAPRYRLRVAINVLRIVERELTLGPSFDAAEVAELAALYEDRQEPGEATADALAAEIRSGERSIDDPQLTRFLRRNLERALRVNNPRWIGASSQPEPAASSVPTKKPSQETP